MATHMIPHNHQLVKGPAGLPGPAMVDESLFGRWQMHADPRIDTIARAKQEERESIGQELHDNVNQILISAKLFLEMLEPAKKEISARDKSLSYIARAIEEIKKISMELVEPEHFDLRSSIYQVISDIRVTTPIRVTLRHNRKTEELAYKKKITLFRIVQEQMKNIITHSRASQVMIKTRYHRGNAILEISDDGIGFDTRRKTKGIGLANIYKRARSQNGSVNLKTAKGRGCTISVILPAA